MPRHSLLTATERENLLGWPEAHAELIRQHTLSPTDMAIIRQHRGAANRLRYAVQLCSMRHPGVAHGIREEPFFPLLKIVAAQLKVPVERRASTGFARRHDESMRLNYRHSSVPRRSPCGTTALAEPNCMVLSVSLRTRKLGSFRDSENTYKDTRR